MTFREWVTQRDLNEETDPSIIFVISYRELPSGFHIIFKRNPQDPDNRAEMTSAVKTVTAQNKQYGNNEWLWNIVTQNSNYVGAMTKALSQNIVSAFFAHQNLQKAKNRGDVRGGVGKSPKFIIDN